MIRGLLTFFLIIVAASSFFAQPINVFDRPYQSGPSHDFDVLHYRIALDFEGDRRAFTGEVTIVLRSLSERLRNIFLHAESYEVSDVRMDQKTLDFYHQEGTLGINLPQALTYGDTVAIVVDYGTTGFEVNPEEFGMGRNYPLGLGFFEANDEHPFLFNAYSFPTGARHWFPGYDHPADRATHETIITTQADHKVLANGVLEAVTHHDNGTVTYHWSHKQAHPTYLYNFVSGPYVIVEDEYNGMPVNYWVYPNDEDKALRSFHRTPDVLAFFEAYYGVKYPWDKYDQICVPGIGGGAEATTATLIGASTLHDEKAEKDFPSHWLVAHEAAHHWWGNLISYSDWTETWMSEGFATFSEYLYSAHLYGPDEGALNIYNKRLSYLDEAKNRYQRPIVCHHWDFPNQNFDRHTYQKGAVVLFMLRDYLGETSFKRVLQHFLTKHAFEPVDTRDLMKSIWEVTGQNLDWFFDQWIFSAGHPILEIDYEWEDQQVKMNVRQVQDTDEHIPYFKLPADVAITTETGTYTHSIWLDQPDQSFTFDCSDKPLMVRFDPEDVLLKEWTFGKSKEELIYQAKHDVMIGRLWSVQRLSAHIDDPGVVEFLEHSAKEDPFWAVRRESLRSLSKAETDLADILKDKLGDKHSRVRTEAVKILGNKKEIRWHTILRRIYDTDDSYVVQAEAVRAMGILKLPADKAFFEKVAMEKSPRNILGNAAHWSLDQLSDR